MTFDPGNAVDFSAAFTASIVMGVGVVDGLRIIDDRTGVPKVQTIYQKAEDQKMYVKLCKEGRTPAEAKELLSLMGINVAPVTDIFEYWGAPEVSKKKLPFYHHKRRF